MLRAVFFGTEGRLRNGWWLAIFIAVLAALLFPLLIVSQHYNHTVGLFDQVLVLLAVTGICQALRRKSLFEVTGRFDLRWVREFLIGGSIGAALMLTPALFLFVTGLAQWQTTHTSFAIIGSGIATMAAVAVAEELLFRGFAFQRLIDGAGVWVAQIVIAGFFLLTHLDNPGMSGATKLWAATNIVLASFLFGFAYLRARSLAMPVGTHFMANVTQGVILGLGVSGNAEVGMLAPHFIGNANWLTGGAFGLEASAPGLVCVAMTTLLLYRRAHRPELPADAAVAA